MTFSPEEKQKENKRKKQTMKDKHIQKKLLYYIHKLLGIALLIIGTCNVYTLSKSYLLAGVIFLTMIIIWNFIFEKICPESKNLVEDFFSGKLSAEELFAEYKLLLESVIHVRTCLYAIFYFLTEVISRCQL